MIDEDIQTLDLEPIAFKVCFEEEWSLERVDDIERKYRIFLHAVRHSTEPIAPSKDVDTFWHHHILDTEKYIDDCQRMFGKYVHHFPYSGLLGDEDEALQLERFRKSQETMAAYEAEVA